MIVLATVSVLATLLVMTVIRAPSGQGAPRIEVVESDAIEGNLTYEEAVGFDDYGIYAVGGAFDDMPLTAITRRLDAPDPALPANARPRGANWVNFIYADDCQPDEAGISCQSMIQIQTWPACERNLSVLDPALPRKLIELRGVPAAVFPDEQRVEVYAGDSTIVIFADTEANALAVAEKPTLVNAAAAGYGERSPEDAFPLPAAGALEGELPCSGKVETVG